MTPAEHDDYEAELQAKRGRALRSLHALIRKEGKPSHGDHLRALADTPPELWGAHEAAACLGVARNNLGVLRGLPAPVTRISNGAIAVYVADEIRAFADTRRG